MFSIKLFWNSKPHKRDSNSLKIKKCPLRGDSPRWAIVSDRLDRVVYEIASFTMSVLYQTRGEKSIPLLTPTTSGKNVLYYTQQ